MAKKWVVYSLTIQSSNKCSQILIRSFHKKLCNSKTNGYFSMKFETYIGLVIVRMLQLFYLQLIDRKGVKNCFLYFKHGVFNCKTTIWILIVLTNINCVTKFYICTTISDVITNLITIFIFNGQDESYLIKTCLVNPTKRNIKWQNVFCI